MTGSPAGTSAAGGVEQLQPGAAVRAADRLGVEPAIGRVVVLRGARRAQGEARHRGQRAVVGNVAHDREPRPAVRAVDERVAEPTVAGVGQLGQAVGAGRAVGRDQRRAASAGLARHNAETDAAAGLDGRRPHRVDPRQRRRLLLKQREEIADVRRRSLDLDEDAGRVVAHLPGQPEPGGQRVDERAEAHPLDHALHLDQRPDVRVPPDDCPLRGGRAGSSGGRPSVRLPKVVAGQHVDERHQRDDREQRPGQLRAEPDIPSGPPG